jgi:hypothetical protein
VQVAAKAAVAIVGAGIGPRTSLIQAISSANTWMQGGDADASWLYGYDAWSAPLDSPPPQPASAGAAA